MDKYLKLNEKNLVVYLFCVALVLVGVGIFLRYWYHQGILIGNESYFHTRMAEDVELISNPFHLLYAGLGALVGINFAGMILQSLVSLLLLWLLLQLMKLYKLSLMERFTIGLLFVSSPMFIRLAMVINVHFFSLMLILAGILFFTKDKNLLTYIMFALATWSSAYAGIVLLVLIVIYYIFVRNSRVMLPGAVVALILAVSREFIPVFSVSNNLFTSFISDLGATFGFSVYLILLAAIGFLLAWRANSKFTFINVFLLIVFLLSITWDLAFNVFALIPICILATDGILHLANREWESTGIRNILLVVLIFGIVMSAFSSVTAVVDSEPSIEIYESLMALKDNADEGDIVFADFEKSEWIRGVAGLEVVSDFDNRNEEDMRKVFEARSPSKVVQYFSEKNVDYIWLDIRTVDKFSLERKRGFLLFLENKDNFEKVYSNEQAELWKFVGVHS